MKRITESQLIIPALSILSQSDEFMSSKSLKTLILKMIKPKKLDLEKLKGRNQTIISSRIDNLTSHRTLDKYVDYSKIGGTLYLRINGKGKTFLSKKLLEIV